MDRLIRIKRILFGRLFMLLALVGAFLGVSSGSVLAEWRSEAEENYGVFYAGAYSNPGYIGLRCIGPLLGQPTTAADVSFSPAHGFLLEFSPQAVAPPSTTYNRSDLAVWVDGTGYQIPQMSWTELDGVWVAPLQMTDPLVNALLTGRDVIVGPVVGTQYRLSSAGMNEAVRAAMSFCIPRFAGLGYPVPAALAGFAAGSAPSSSERGGDRLEDLVNARIVQGCQAGGQTAEAGHILRGLIDGDDEVDFVIDWRKISCNRGPARPFCGASNCAADLFLSSISPQAGTPDSYLALGVQLVDLSNGRKGMQLGGSLSSCHAAGKGPNGCQFVWFWNGTQMSRLP